MNWLFLNPAEIAILWSVAGAAAVWLYLHHRQAVRRRVSSLRFWTSVQPKPQMRRQRLREPWALLAQLLFLLFVIAALANPRWGVEYETRNVVMVLDGSIWSQMRSPNGTTWIARVRDQARRFLDSLPANDRVLLLRADLDVPPILPFTQDRVLLRRTIASLQTSSGVADVPHALDLGKAALAGSRHALLVYIGPGMLDDAQSDGLAQFRRTIEPPDGTGNRPQFLVRLVGANEPIQNSGITRLAIRRDTEQPDHWHLLTQIKNYNNAEANVLLRVSVDGQPLWQQGFALAPDALADMHNEFTWSRGGLLQAEIGPSDSLPTDNRAFAYLPPFKPVHVAVYGDPRLAAEMRPVLSTNPFLRTEFVHPGANPVTRPDVGIYEGTEAPTKLAGNSIWFVRGRSAPTAVTSSNTSGSPRVVRLDGWNLDHPVTRWVRTRDVSIRNAAVLQTQPGDVVLASAAEGNPPDPLIIARQQNGFKSLILGFDPKDSNFPMQPAFPLLLAAGIEWMTYPIEDVQDPISAGEVDFAGAATRVIAPSGRSLPFARSGPDIHLLAPEAGVYHVISARGAKDVAVNVPLLPSQRWRPNSFEAAAVASEPSRGVGRDMWTWLVPLAMVALWAEWWLFYKRPPKRQPTTEQQTPLSGIGRGPEAYSGAGRYAHPQSGDRKSIVGD